MIYRLFVGALPAFEGLFALISAEIWATGRFSYL